MNNKINIQTKVDEAMQSFEGMQSATPGAFFFTRVKARLNKAERNVWEKISSFIARPVVAVAVICFVILMNGIVVFHQKEISSSFAEQSEQIFYDDDFALASNTFYDYEISEP